MKHTEQDEIFREGKEHHSPDLTIFMNFIGCISKNKSMLLATATPIQMYPIELWDLMNILSQKMTAYLVAPPHSGEKEAKLQKPGFDYGKGKNGILILN